MSSIAIEYRSYVLSELTLSSALFMQKAELSLFFKDIRLTAYDM